MKRRTPNPAGFIAAPKHFYRSLSVLREHSDFDFHCTSQGYPAAGLEYVLTTQHLRVVFVQAATKKEVRDIADVLRKFIATDAPPVVLLAVPEIVLPAASFLESCPAFAGLLPLPFDADLIAAEFEVLRQELTKRMFEIWIYRSAKPTSQDKGTIRKGGAPQTTVPSEEVRGNDVSIITFVTSEGDIHIPVADITCCLALNTYTEVCYYRDTKHTKQSRTQLTKHHLHNSVRHLHSDNLRQWEHQLPKDHFMRVHRSAVVNMNAITRVERHHTRKGLILTLRDGREVKVAREKTQLFLKRYYGNLVVTRDGAHLVVEHKKNTDTYRERLTGGGGRKYPTITTKKFPRSEKAKGTDINTSTQAGKG